MGTVRQTAYSVYYSFRFVWIYNKKYLFFSICVNVIIGLLPLTSIWLFKELINEIVFITQGDHGFSTAVYLLSAQFIIILLGYLLNVFSDINDQKLNNSVGLKLKEHILSKVDRLPYITFENPDFYNRFQRIHMSESQVISIVKDALTFGSSLITIFSLMGYLFQVHWLLVVILFLCTIPLLVVEMTFGSKRYHLMWFLTPYARKEEYVSQLLTTRETLKEVRLFRLGGYLLAEWITLFKLNAIETLKMLKKQSFWVFFANALMSLTYVLSGMFVIFLIVGGRILVGDFVAVLQAIQNIQSGFSDSARTLSKFYEGSLYIQDLEAFFQMKESEKEGRDVQIEEIKEIRLHKLRFRYPNQETEAIKEVDHLTIQPGKKIAIVGENGSGKTTLIKCLTGLYETEAGMIRVNGVSLDQVNLPMYQDRMAVLFQDFIRYNFSARHNIGFGRVDHLENVQEIRRAADQVQMDQYLSSLPEQYDSILGRLFEGGNELSGGQWQKVALARAIFRKSDVIILDEPTSSLDPKAEVAIIEQLFSLAEKKAILYITHRLGAACLADEILVLRNGSVVEQGNHEDLLKQGGEYSLMYRTQAKWYTGQNAKAVNVGLR